MSKPTLWRINVTTKEKRNISFVCIAASKEDVYAEFDKEFGAEFRQSCSVFSCISTPYSIANTA